jgi:hypothetical protein
MPVKLPNITSEWMDKVFSVKEPAFEPLALEIFHYQYHHNLVYANYCNAVGKNPSVVKHLTDIPFLPIIFFKTRDVVSGLFLPEVIFQSSGTTGMVNSRHLVKDVSVYQKSFTNTFQQFYGEPGNWCIIALLPSYLERGNSSLVRMADQLIKDSTHPQSGFYLYDYEKLRVCLQQLERAQQPCLLLGVTFALLDFAEKYPLPLNHTIVMETGGMKGRRQEWTRAEIHNFLQKQLHTRVIHSEYGMTELLSQAYSSGNGIFNCPPWMKILLREEDDPLHILTTGKGVINVIDLANIHSCSFIATDDAGKLYANGSFEVLGRIDNSDIRGCSLLAV